MKILKFAILCCVPLAAQAVQASELSSYCNMVNSEAEIRSQVLSAPEAFTTVGTDSTNQKVLTAGIRKSFTNAHQATLTTRLGEAQCSAYKLESQISESLKDIDAQVDREGLAEKQTGLKIALGLADANLAQEQNLLKHQLATWSDVRTALETRDQIQQDLLKTEQAFVIYKQVPQYAAVSLSKMLVELEPANAQVAKIKGDLSSASAWDVSVSAGAIRVLATGAQSPYIGVNISRSFGYDGAKDAVRRNVDASVSYGKDQESGVWQQLDRKRAQMEGEIRMQSAAQRSTEEKLVLLSDARSQVDSVDTLAAKRIAANLAIETVQARAELNSVNRRIRMMKQWLELQAQ